MEREMGSITWDGVTLQGPGPVGSVDLRFQPGVDVLYGLNGAGKTAILRGLLTAIGARKGKAGGMVHATITERWITREPEPPRGSLPDDYPNESPWLAHNMPWWHYTILEEA